MDLGRGGGAWPCGPRVSRTLQTTPPTTLEGVLYSVKQRAIELSSPCLHLILSNASTDIPSLGSRMVMFSETHQRCIANCQLMESNQRDVCRGQDPGEIGCAANFPVSFFTVGARKHSKRSWLILFCLQAIKLERS